MIPSRAQFVEAYTNYSSDYYTYTCAGCQVYFAPSDPSLPSSISPSTPFDSTMIQTKFLLGTQNSSGVWISPYGTATKYVAFKIDNAR